MVTIDHYFWVMRGLPELWEHVQRDAADLPHMLPPLQERLVTMVAESQGQSIVVPEYLVSDAQLAEIDSFEDALDLVNEVFGGDVILADKEIGNGFAILDNKDSLIGVEMLILKATQNPSEKGTKGFFTSLHIVTRDGRKVIVNDGGSGIHEQISELWTRKPEMKGKPILVRKGLRVSRYDHPEYGPSETHYLDTSAKE